MDNYRYYKQDIVGGSELMDGRRHVRTGTNGLVIHTPHTGGLEGVKEFLEKRSIANIPNKYLIAGAAVAGIAYYGYTHRWF